MSRKSIDIEDYLEDKINSYMKLNKIKTKNKAINDILNIFFENEKFFENFKDLDYKIDRILGIVSLSKNLNEQIYANLGFRENLNPNEDEFLNEFYNNIKKNKYKIFNWFMEKYIKKWIRIKKSINDKIDIINREIEHPYSYLTLEYLLELGILKYEELKFKNTNDEELFLKLNEVKLLLEKVLKNE